MFQIAPVANFSYPNKIRIDTHQHYVDGSIWIATEHTHTDNVGRFTQSSIDIFCQLD